MRASVTGTDLCDQCRGERPAGWSHGRVEYFSRGTPCDYRCGACGVTDCRLYREYSTFVVDLRCLRCVEAQTGRRWDPDEKHSLGWWVAAVPTENGGGYWGYTNVPQPGVAWWDALPVYGEARCA